MNLLTDDEIARLRRRRAEPAFAAAWASLEERAQAALTDTLAIPPPRARAGFTTTSARTTRRN